MTHTIEYLDGQGNVRETVTSTLFAPTTRAAVGQGISGEVFVQDAKTDEPPALDNRTIGLVNDSIFDLVEQDGRVQWKPSRGPTMTFELRHTGDFIRLMLYEGVPAGEKGYRGLRVIRNESSAINLPQVAAP